MSDSRTARNELKEFFGGPIQTWASEFSGSASLVFPGAGNHLRIYKVILSASSDNANTVGAQILDGADLKALLYVPAGGVRILSFDGRHLPVSGALRLTRADNDDALSVFVGYREVADV
jgi:hypothetical protein